MNTLISQLLRMTRSNELVWEYLEGQICMSCFANGQEYVICKYQNDTNNVWEISFNLIDDEGYIIEPFREFNENHPQFRILNELYETAERNKQLAVA